MSAVEIAVEVAGWTGALLILLGYLAITTGKLTGDSALYQWINVAGAAGFVVNGWWHGAVPSAALNVSAADRSLRLFRITATPNDGS